MSRGLDPSPDGKVCISIFNKVLEAVRGISSVLRALSTYISPRYSSFSLELPGLETFTGQ